MKTIDAKKIGLKILRFDTLKYPDTNSKTVAHREFKFIAGDRQFHCVVSAREAKTATDALAKALSFLESQQSVTLVNLPQVQIVSDKTAAEWCER